MKSSGVQTYHKTSLLPAAKLISGSSGRLFVVGGNGLYPSSAD